MEGRSLVSFSMNDAIEKLFLVATVGFWNAADALELMLLIFGHSARCQWNISPEEEAFLTTLVFIGIWYIIFLPMHYFFMHPFPRYVFWSIHRSFFCPIGWGEEQPFFLVLYYLPSQALQVRLLHHFQRFKCFVPLREGVSLRLPSL